MHCAYAQKLSLHNFHCNAIFHYFTVRMEIFMRAFLSVKIPSNHAHTRTPPLSHRDTHKCTYANINAVHTQTYTHTVAA